MSVVNPSVSSPPRNISHTVRLAPYLVETLCELARAARERTQGQPELGGLLFGTAEEGLTVVEALRTFDESGPRSDLAKRERLDRAFESTMAQADEDAELASCRAIGWFSLRSASGLLASDVDFHNRHFQQAEDLALVIWREADTQVIAELYAKTDIRALSGDDYRWSSVRLSTELRRVSEPIELAMRAKVTADSYLRAYRNSEENEKRDDWKKVAAAAKRGMLSLFPRRSKSEDYRVTGNSPERSYGRQPLETGTIFRRTDGYAEPMARSMQHTSEVSRMRDVSRMLEPSRMGEPFRTPRYQDEEISGLPMVISAPKQRSGVPWLSTALVFVTFSAITFAVLAVKGTQSGNGKIAQIMRVIFPTGDLGLHVDSQGDRLLLSWNRRNPVVASAADGVLQIFDGTQHREVRLDGGQVADGSVLYKALSSDVTFRLEVHATDQSSVMGSMRVLDATSPAPTGHEATLDLTATAPPAHPAAAPPNPLPVPDTAKPDIAKSAAEKTPAPTAVNTKNIDRGQVVIYRNPSSSRVVPVPVSNRSTKEAESNQNQARQNSGSTQPPALQPPPIEAKTNAPQADNSSDSSVPANPSSRAAGQRAPAGTPAAQPPTAGSTINGWDPGLPEAPPPATTNSTDAKTAFVPPKPLLQVMPNTRSLSPGLISQVTRVEVAVRVDNAGHVTTAHVLNENGATKGALSNAAISAARQWTFQPATLQGEKVESEHTIVFEFRPENQQ